jgi:UDP-GlcNAc:undecaprenyl-phosphate/decaprenyl-phosphate GlcNAc-1-phosphate transferase
MDHPTERKTHGHPMPRTGGIALWLAITLGQGLGWLNVPITSSEWVCLHGLALLGALDDRFSLRPFTKALVGFVVAVALAIPVAQAFAVDRPEVVLMSMHIATNPPWVVISLLVLWFWALPQSFNLIDGMNGLAIGLALITLFALQVGLGTGHGTFLLGVLIATFFLNWPRPKHFLGDCGSYFLGGFLGLLALKTKAFIYPSHALWVFAYPILDTALVILTRTILRRPIGLGDRNHYHHHWSRLLGKRAGWTVPILWLQGAALATRPLYLPGSALLAWGTLGLMLGQGAFFLYMAWRQSDSMGHG